MVSSSTRDFPVRLNRHTGRNDNSGWLSVLLKAPIDNEVLLAVNVVIPSPLPVGANGVRSGVDRYLLELSQGLRETGQVRILTSAPVSDEGSSSIPDSGDATPDNAHLSNPLLPATLALILGSLKEVLALRRVYRRLGDPSSDIFHAQRVGCEFQTIAARLAGYKCVIATVHNLPGEDVRARHWFRRFVEWLSFACARELICVSQATFDAWQQRVALSSEKVTVIYNGMAPPQLLVEERAADRRALGISDNSLVIGICARLHRMKGHDVLLRAFGLMMDRLAEVSSPAPEDLGVAVGASIWQQTGIVLLIAGSGPEEQALRSIAAGMDCSGAIRFVGHQDDGARFAGLLDINVLPSVSLETLGYSVVEGMFAGVPSVVSDVGGMKELVDASGGGIVVPAGDAEALADALAHYVLDPMARQQDGAHAIAYAREKLQRARMVEETLLVYRRVNP